MFSYRPLYLILACLLCGSAAVAQPRCALSAPASPVREVVPSLVMRGAVIIPVAVHVVWQNPEENISDAQIESQLEVLNRDYRRLNAEAPNVHPLFDDLVSDLEIEFCLVAITRTLTTVAGITNTFSGGARRLCHTDLGGRDGFDPERYLNIWVAGRSDGALGSATFPQEGLAKPEEDGLYIRPDAFGTMGTVAPPFHLGRTCTHELGHYFNLQHLWGPNEDNFNCDKDDGIADTPLQATTYQGTCPAVPFPSCGSPDMFMNYMNFTHDACMALFTPGQKARVLNTLQTYRQGLLETSCAPVSTTAPPLPDRPEVRLLSNPVSNLASIQVPGNETALLTIFDFSGRLVQQEKATGPVIELNLRGIYAGIYYIKIRYGDKIHLKKLIIAR
ncbi:MAG: M43 family zinc metalloprotease [Phaeodactylibacter sp.]|uniref:M43 family zinc metalloprotease n=1 Tax=Phaeodactylibacter sp. TaxID=1940289 RepID=UPI0032EEAD95